MSKLKKGRTIYLACSATVAYLDKNKTYYFSGTWSVEPFETHWSADEYLKTLKAKYKDRIWEPLTVQGRKGIGSWAHGDCWFLFVDTKIMK
jgi:hypothetical protein